MSVEQQQQTAQVAKATQAAENKKARANKARAKKTETPTSDKDAG